MRQARGVSIPAVATLVAAGLLLWAQAASAADLAGARALLVWIYSHYPAPADVPDAKAFIPTGRSRDAVFDPPMVALLRENERLTPKGDEGTPHWDVICSCQDDGGMVVRRILVSRSGDDGATATVDLRFARDHTTLKFELVRLAGRWRIHDIHTNDTPSLRALMARANRDAARDRRSRR